MANRREAIHSCQSHRKASTGSKMWESEAHFNDISWCMDFQTENIKFLIFSSRWKINRKKLSACENWKRRADARHGLTYGRASCMQDRNVWYHPFYGSAHACPFFINITCRVSVCVCVCVHITFDKRLEFSSMSLSFLLCSHKQWMENGEKRRRFSVLWSDMILWISIYIIFSTWKIQFLLQRAPVVHCSTYAQARLYTNF